MLEDVQPTIEAIGIPQDKIILFGRSVGSLFAIKAAELFPGVAGLILESAIADPLERLLLRVHPEELNISPENFNRIVLEAIDIEDILTNFCQPVLIMHTRNDELIDVSHAEKLAEWCAGPVRTQIFSRGGHNDIMFVNSRDYFQMIYEFVLSLKE